jgi:serine/threonine protein kinase
MLAGASFCGRCGAKAAPAKPPRRDEDVEVTVRLHSRSQPAPQGADRRAGELIGDFELEREIARGGMGVVYLARQRRLDRHVAIKLISPELARDPAFRTRFREEALLTAGFSHPNIVPVYDADEHNGELYIAMGYVDGPDLRTLIAREGALDPARAARIVSQVGSALDAAHARGLVHRDVKPANILLSSPGPGETAYLTDFGVLKRLGDSSGVTGTGQWMGTLDYASPEQIDRGPLDARTDVYALGCVLFKALTGEVPFPRDTPTRAMWAHVNEPPPAPATRRPDVPAEFDAVIRQAMAKAPADRFISAGALGKAALTAAQGVPAIGFNLSATGTNRQFAGGLTGSSSAFPTGRLTGIQTPPPQPPRDLLVPPESAGGGNRRKRQALIASLVLGVVLAATAVALVLTGVFSGNSRADAVQAAKKRSLGLVQDTDKLTRELTSLTTQLNGNPSTAQKRQIKSKLIGLQKSATQIRRRAAAQPKKPGGNDPRVRYANATIQFLMTNDGKVLRTLVKVSGDPKTFGPQLGKALAAWKKNARQITTLRTVINTDGPLPYNPLPGRPVGPKPPTTTPSTPQPVAGPSWTKLPGVPHNLDPSSVMAQSIAYDGNLNQPIAVFSPGGTGDPTGCGSGQLETWALSDSGWSKVTTANAPSDCPGVAMAYDPANGETVLVQTAADGTRTWTFDGTDWTDASPQNEPTDTGPLAYDQSNDELLMAGQKRTWKWDGTDWVDAGEGTGQTAITAAYSSSDKRVVAIVGTAADESVPGKTVAFDGSQWTDTGTTAQLPGNGALEPTSGGKGLMYLSGQGSSAVPAFSEWRWDGTAWTEDTPSPAPPTLDTFASAADPDTGAVYLLGFPLDSSGSPGSTAETWVSRSP